MGARHRELRQHAQHSHAACLGRWYACGYRRGVAARCARGPVTGPRSRRQPRGCPRAQACTAQQAQQAGTLGNGLRPGASRGSSRTDLQGTRGRASLHKPPMRAHTARCANIPESRPAYSTSATHLLFTFTSRPVPKAPDRSMPGAASRAMAAARRAAPSPAAGTSSFWISMRPMSWIRVPVGGKWGPGGGSTQSEAGCWL